LSLSRAVCDVERRLADVGVPDARTDAELLVAHVLGLSRSQVYAAREGLDEATRSRLDALVERRRRREPLQHVLGEWAFRRLALRVDRRALVPRPETEVVVERCLALVAELAEPHILDVGTGSGAIALALADEHPGARVVGVDSSADALALARENVEQTGLGARVELVHGHLFSGLDAPFDLVVSNPPYVEPTELAALEPEVRDHDPRAALVAPGVTEAIACGARDVLRPGGHLVLETASDRANQVGRLLEALGYGDVAVTRDLAGAPRVVEGTALTHPLFDRTSFFLARTWAANAREPARRHP
jgi:release factor glutamine methyltransferase